MNIKWSYLPKQFSPTVTDEILDRIGSLVSQVTLLGKSVENLVKVRIYWVQSTLLELTLELTQSNYL